MATRVAGAVLRSFVVPLLGAACSSFGGGAAGTTPPGPNPEPDSGLPPITGTPSRGIEVTVGDPLATAFVVQGRSLTLPVKLTRKESSVGPVTITVSKLPKDVTVDALTIPAGAVEATLTLKAAATSPQGATVLDIAAVEGGSQGAGAATKVSAFVRGTPGALDTTFGTQGVARHLFGAGKHVAVRDLVVLGDDRLVVVSECGAGGFAEFACVTQTSADGVTNTAYGTGGTATLGIPTLGQAVADVAGGVLLSGNAGANSLSIGRLTDKGQPDATFGNGTAGAAGTYTFAPLPGGTPEGARSSLAVRKDGTIVLGFNHATGGATKTLGLAVFTAKGAPVTGFGTSGIFFGSQLVGLTVPAVGGRANGNIWTASIDPAGGNPFCYAYEHDAITGVVVGAGLGVSCQTNPNSATGGAVALADGSVVPAFHSGTTIVIAKSIPDGSRLDLVWGTGGIATINEDAVPSVSVDKKGVILVALLRDGGLRFMRLTAGGAPDTSFGNGGTVVHAFGMNHQIARAFVQKDGRIVVAGTEDFVDGSDATLSRYWD